MAVCCVPFCGAKKRNNLNLSFHQFPCNDEVRKKWLYNIRNGTMVAFFEPSETMTVCSQHFSIEDFEANRRIKHLKKKAVPVYFVDNRKQFFVGTSGVDIMEPAQMNVELSSNIQNQNENRMTVSQHFGIEDFEVNCQTKQLKKQEVVLLHFLEQGKQFSTGTSSVNTIEPSQINEDLSSMQNQNENTFLDIKKQKEGKRVFEDVGCVTVDHDYCEATISSTVPLSQDLVTSYLPSAKRPCLRDASVQVHVISNNPERKKNMRNMSIKLSNCKRKMKRLSSEVEKLKSKLQKFKSYEKILNDEKKGNVKAIILAELINAHGKQKFKWSKKLLRDSILCYYRSPKAYLYFRKNFINLPSCSSLKKFIGNYNDDGDVDVASFVKQHLTAECMKLSDTEEFET